MRLSRSNSNVPWDDRTVARLAVSLPRSEGPDSETLIQRALDVLDGPLEIRITTGVSSLDEEPSGASLPERADLRMLNLERVRRREAAMSPFEIPAPVRPGALAAEG